MPHMIQPNGPLGAYYDGSTPLVGYNGLPGEAMTAGTGITTGQTGIPYLSYVSQDGPFVKTTIFIDLQGLASSTAGDIIGKDGGTANCHFGQFTLARNGAIFRGQISCVETPATGEPDVDVWSATEATGAEDAAVSGLAETAIQDAAADYTKGVTKAFTGNLVADQYLYLASSGGGDAAVYTAGQFVIETWGIKV